MLIVLGNFILILTVQKYVKNKLSCSFILKNILSCSFLNKMILTAILQGRVITFYFIPEPNDLYNVHFFLSDEYLDGFSSKTQYFFPLTKFVGHWHFHCNTIALQEPWSKTDASQQLKPWSRHRESYCSDCDIFSVRLACGHQFYC